jgi:hypothetical protein
VKARKTALPVLVAFAVALAIAAILAALASLLRYQGEGRG